MKSLAILCVSLLLLALCLPSSEGKRHRYRGNRRSKCKTGVQIEIYNPKGLMVWYPKRPNMSEFRIEIFLNQKDSTDDEAVCDVCLNTTEVSYGKFIIRSDDAIIRGGDHLMYNAFKINANGSVYAIESNEFHVAESRIISRQAGCSSRSRSSIASVADDKKKIAMLEDELNVLENIVYGVIEHCNNVTQISKNLYLNFRPVDTRLDSRDLFNYTSSVLKEMLPKVDWDTVLIYATYYEDGVAFEVKTLIDKLKVLQMAKDLTNYTVSDLDELDGTLDEDNEIAVSDMY